MDRVMLTVIIIFILLTNGCSTFVTKNAEISQFGNAYSGVEYATLIWGTCTLKTLPFGIVLIPFAVVDITTSAVLDTLLLPIDLIKETPPNMIESGCAGGH